MNIIKNNSKSFIIIALLIMIFTINVGYAKTSNQELSCTPYNSDFHLEFSNPVLENYQGINKEKTNIILTNNNQALVVNVSELAYPGAGAEFSVNIVNSGSLKTKIDSIKVSGLDNSNLKVSVLNEDSIINKELNPNQSCKINFTVVWDYNSKYLNETNFELLLNYSQVL